MNLAMLWLSQLIILAGFQALGPFIPLFIKHDLGVVNEESLAFYVAMFQFFGTLAYCIFNPIWGRLSDRYGAKLMLLRGTFVTAFFFPMMAYVKSPEMLLFLRFLTAACAGTTAISNMMIVRNTPNNKQGFALGLLATAIWGGGMLGNVFCGFIIHYFGYKVSFWICGIRVCPQRNIRRSFTSLPGLLFFLQKIMRHRSCLWYTIIRKNGPGNLLSRNYPDMFGLFSDFLPLQG